MAEAENWLTQSRPGNRRQGTVTPDPPILQYSAATANPYILIAEAPDPETDPEPNSPVLPRTLVDHTVPEELLDSGATFPNLVADVSTFYVQSPIQLLEDPDSDSDSDSDASSTSTTDSETSDSDWEDEKMSDITSNPTEVKDLYLAEPEGNLTPIETPTKMQILKFIDTLATALTHCASRLGHLGGQTYLVLTETEYKMRVGNQDKSKPTRPVEPDPYDNANYASKTWKVFKHNHALFKETQNYDWQVIALIKVKFPKGLHGLYDKQGHLSLDTTAQTALETLKANIVDKTETTRCCQEIRTKLSGRKHTRAANGAEDYFWKAEQDQLMLVRLGSPRVPHHIVIAAATVAFKECGYSKELLGKTAMEWEEKATTIDLDAETTMPLFVAHWNLALKLIHQHSDFPAGRANKAEDVTRLVETAVASALAAHTNINDEFNDVLITEQNNLSRRLDGLEGGSTLPSISSATTGTALSALEQSNNTIAELQRQLALTRVTTPPPTIFTGTPKKSRIVRNTPNTTDKPRRQWNQWCSSCGSNFDHLSGGCPRPGPNHNKAATKENPLGGNSRRDHLFGLWCNPVDNSICDKAVD